MNDKSLRLAVFELEGNLVRDKQRAQRHDDSPRAEHAEIGDREGRHVRDHQGDFIARLDAAGQKLPGKAADRLLDVAIAQADVVINGGRQLRIQPGRIT